MEVVINMIYLDYSATTPVNDEVIESYSKACKEYIGNPNSLHRLG
jgi:cysteine desulfurase